MLRIVVFFYFLSFLFFQKAWSFPVFFYASEIPGFKEGVWASSQLVAVGKNTKGEWVELDLQIEEMEEGAQVVRNPQWVLPTRRGLPQPIPQDPYGGRLMQFHRLSVDHRLYSTLSESDLVALKGQQGRYCLGEVQASFVVESKTLRQAFALFVCNKRATSSSVGPLSNIDVNLDQRRITSSTYQFSYDSGKNLLPRKVTSLGKIGRLSIERTQFFGLIRSIVSKTEFTEKQLEYYPTSVETKRYSQTIEVAAKFNIGSFFQTKPLICCDISFYDDSFTFPVIINSPVPPNWFSTPSVVFFGLGGAEGRFLSESDISVDLPAINENGTVKEVLHRGIMTFSNPDQDFHLVVSLGADVRKGIYPGWLNLRQSTPLSELDGIKALQGVLFDLTKIKTRNVSFEVWAYFTSTSGLKKVQQLGRWGFRHAIRPF